MRIIITIIFLLITVSADAANKYVSSRAAGSADGSDWTNAYTSLPASLTRGNTYYFADGSYGGYTFDDAVDGTTTIIIKKATVAEHGTETGWSNDLGDGVAVFTGAFYIATDYITIDGATGGGPASWKSGHGFEFTSSAGTSIEYIEITSGVTNLTIRHVYFNQVGDTEATTARANGIYCAGNLYNSIFEYNYFDNLGGLPFLLRYGSGNIFQYNYTGNICGMSEKDYNQHCEAFVIHTMSDIHFRWNYIGECPSTGGFVKNDLSGTASDVRIYGNVFNGNYPIQINGTDVDWRIFNNTFVGMVSGPVVTGGYSALLYNNISFNGDLSKSPGPYHGYNWYSQIDSTSCNTEAVASENITINFPGSCDAVAETDDPFVDSGGTTPENFRLTAAITDWDGYNVCLLDACTGEKKYNIDAFGNTRGNDGTWDRGAYEYVSGSPPVDETAPVMSNASPSGTITCTSATTMDITESFQTDESATGRGSATNQSYDDMGAGKNYTTTGGTTHSRTTSRACGASYTVYSQAADTTGNKTSTALVTTYTISAWNPGNPSVTIPADYSYDVDNTGIKYYHDGDDWAGKGTAILRTVNRFPLATLASNTTVQSVEVRFYVDSKAGSAGTLSINRYGSSHGEDNPENDSAATAYSNCAGTQYATLSEPGSGAWTSWVNLGATSVTDLQYLIDNTQATMSIGVKASSDVESGGSNNYVAFAEDNEANDAEIRVTYTLETTPPGLIYFGIDRAGSMAITGGTGSITWTAP